MHKVRGDLAAGIGIRAANGLDVRAEDRLAVAARPLVRAAWTVGGALEARHHVAREQLVAVQRLLAVRPVVGAEEHAAEERPQLLDALDDRLQRRRAVASAAAPALAGDQAVSVGRR